MCVYVHVFTQGALQRLLMSTDVPGAVSFVEGEITRLLTGRVGVWELAMTGGLWRVTGQQLEKAAAAGGGEVGGGGCVGLGDVQVSSQQHTTYRGPRHLAAFNLHKMHC